MVEVRNSKSPLYDRGPRRSDNAVTVQPGPVPIKITNREPGVFGQYFPHPFNKYPGSPRFKREVDRRGPR
ncbi:hypothetical protein HY024_03180 [Candidatus Curtissbacteria bacterium]|nr:hypothetical protein [Candidatus Curtissbacteria bacterium]